MIYKQKDLVQGSEEWHDFRLGGIGASEIPVLSGDIPLKWNSPFELFLLKLGKPPEEPNDAMKRGTLLEESARRFITNYLKEEFVKDNTVFKNNVKNYSEIELEHKPKFEQLTAKHPNYDFIFTSLDGIDKKNKLLLEIKCPSEANFKKNIKKGEIPAYYKAQIQAQLMIANAHWGIKNGLFCQYYPEGVYIPTEDKSAFHLIRLIVMKTELDEEYCEELIQLCSDFWEMVNKKTWDPDWNKKYAK